jgi:predicted TIM-barrel fold metal-dependent hydrolase
MLRTVLDEIGPRRVFFGSDGPYYNSVFPLDRWVKAFTDTDLASCREISFSHEEIDYVMGQAFANLVKTK